MGTIEFSRNGFDKNTYRVLRHMSATNHDQWAVPRAVSAIYHAYANERWAIS